MRVIGPAAGKFDRPSQLSSDGRHVWVANRAGDSVTELDASTGKVVQVLSGSTFGFNHPSGISSDGTRVWVTNNGGNTVTELDAATGALVKILKGDNALGITNPYRFAFPVGVSSDGANVWVTNYYGATVTGFPAG